MPLYKTNLPQHCLKGVPSKCISTLPHKYGIFKMHISPYPKVI